MTRGRYYYAQVQRLDPGFVAGGDPSHATRYWAALEKLPTGVGAPVGVCDRSELFKPPRASYSKYAKGLVRTFDHDCPWVARAVGKGNHLAFVLMLACGEVALICWPVALYYGTPPEPHTTWARALHGDAASVARAHVALVGVPLIIILNLMVLILNLMKGSHTVAWSCLSTAASRGYPSLH